MTLAELKEIVEDEFGSEDLDRMFCIAKHVIADIIKQHGTNWQIVDAYFWCGRRHKIRYTERGYRKNTTGEYVPHAYRRNFGWKNTFYQAGELDICLSRQMLMDIRNTVVTGRPVL